MSSCIWPTHVDIQFTFTKTIQFSTNRLSAASLFLKDINSACSIHTQVTYPGQGHFHARVRQTSQTSVSLETSSTTSHLCGCCGGWLSLPDAQTTCRLQSDTTTPGSASVTPSSWLRWDPCSRLRLETQRFRCCSVYCHSGELHLGRPKVTSKNTKTIMG